MLETFIRPRPEGTEGCHWDGNSQNVCLMNLRWDTPEANRLDSRRQRWERKRRAWDQLQELALERIRTGWFGEGAQAG